MQRITTNPFIVGGVEIPGPVVLAVLLAWKGGATDSLPPFDLPKAPKNLKESLIHVPNYAICVGCYRIVGKIEGGYIKSSCSKCSNSPEGEFWRKGRTYSNLLRDWASDKIVCAVIGTVLEFNSGLLKPPIGNDHE